MKEDTKVQIGIAILTVFFSVGISLYVVNIESDYAKEANNISNNAVEVAREAVEHSKTIEESTLKIGTLRTDVTSQNFSILLFNSYYARYPAYITSGKIYTDENSTEVPIFSDVDDKLLVGQGEWQQITIMAGSYLNKKQNGTYNLSVEIHYIDYAEMGEKATQANFQMVVEDHKIISMTHTGVTEIEYPVDGTHGIFVDDSSVY